MRRRAELQQRLLTLVSSLPAVQVQNRLMAGTDRELALCLFGMTGDDQERVLATISRQKADRVRDELSLLRTRRVEEKHHERSLAAVIASLSGDRVVSTGARRGYLRPRGRGRDA